MCVADIRGQNLGIAHGCARRALWSVRNQSLVCLRCYVNYSYYTRYIERDALF